MFLRRACYYSLMLGNVHGKTLRSHDSRIEQLCPFRTAHNRAQVTERQDINVRCTLICAAVYVQSAIVPMSKTDR
jgi:hypothetical protein